MGVAWKALGGFLVGAASAAAATVVWRRATGRGARPALDPDEQVTWGVRAALEDRGLWEPTLDVTTVDRVVYLRGRAPQPERLEALLAVVRQVPGVAEVKDETKKA